MCSVLNWAKTLLIKQSLRNNHLNQSNCLRKRRKGPNFVLGCAHTAPISFCKQLHECSQGQYLAQFGLIHPDHCSHERERQIIKHFACQYSSLLGALLIPRVYLIRPNVSDLRSLKNIQIKFTCDITCCGWQPFLKGCHSFRVGGQTLAN